MRTSSAGRRLAALAIGPGLILAGSYAFASYRAAGVLGFPLDDAWIHAQFARSLASGHGFSYTGGQWVSGSTAPLWTVLLAAGYLLGRNVVAAAMVLGAICQALAAYYAIRLAEVLGAARPAALLAGTLVAVTPILVWGAVSGMEVPLAAGLVLAGLYHHFRARDAPGPVRYLGAVLLGASALARPENLALAAVVFLGDLLGSTRGLVQLRRTAARVLVVAAIVAPIVVLSRATLGRPLPSTFYAKSGPGLVRAIETRDSAMASRDLLRFGPLAVGNFWLILEDQFSWAAYLGVLGTVSALAVGRSRPVALSLTAVLIAVPFFMGATAPQRLKPDNVRYAAQLVALLPPILAAGASHLFRRRAILLIVMLLACVLTVLRATAGAGNYARSVKNIQELHVTAGRWIAHNLPEDAVVAVNDVGAIAYFSGRRVLDLEGLVSPEVLTYRNLPDRGVKVVADMRPDYLVIFPGWYPDIPRSGMVREIHRFTISDNYISAGDTLIVYQTPWAVPR